MHIQNQIDVQCNKIASGLSTLKEVMDQPLACKVLELETNLDSGRNFDQLLRLERSLLQYLERKGDLLYVGLVGHFSSGKSSTINSLLNIWGSKSAREVNLNPTDKAITLITHPKNSKSLIGLKREGLIPVRTDLIEHDFLTNIVLADTPGSGDPLLVNEMVRDFLPVCDILLYFLSAASPFTSADMPMLKAKNKELKFIPMKFVITRGDEFRRDKSVSLSEDNFDTSLSDIFLDEVISRVGKILGDNPDKGNDFIILDNLSCYNISCLKNCLLDQSNIQDSSKRILMHGHKVAYFISHSQAIQSYFKGLLERKTDVLKKIVDHAKLNITRYQDKVQITNNKLTGSWIKNISLLENVRTELIRKIEDSKEGLTLQENSFNEAKLLDWQAEVAHDIEGHSISQIDDIIRDLESHALKTLTISFQELRTELRSVNIDELKATDLDTICRFNFNLDSSTLNLNMPHHLSKRMEACHDILCDIVLDKLALLITGLNSLHSRLVALQPIKELEEIVLSSISSLENDIITYFDNVHVYRSGVFAIQVREAISKLGIEKELDDIESEFKDDFKEKVTRDAKDQIFPEVNVSLRVHTLKLRDLLDLCKQRREAVKTIEGKDTKSVGPINQLLSYDEASWFEAINAYVKQVKDYLATILMKTHTRLVKLLSEYMDSLDDLKKRRKKRLRKITLAAGAITLIIFLLCTHLNYVPDQTLSLLILIGIISTLIGNFIGYYLARATDKFPERFGTLRKEYEKKLMIDCQEIIDAAFKEFHLSHISSQPLLAFIQNTWTRQAETYKNNTLKSQAESDYKQVKNLSQQYIELINDYRLLIDEMSRIYTGYFRDIESNLERLQSISKSISTVAIEPSFQLIDTTHRDLLQVRETIATTTFA